MAMRKTTDWTTPLKRAEEAKFIGTRPGKYALSDNADKTNKALAAKRKKEAEARSKKDARSQKRGLKAANKPLRKTPARTEATRLAGQRAEEARKKYIERTGPKMTDAQRIARDRVTGFGIPNPPGRLKKAMQTADRILAQSSELAAKNAAAKRAAKKDKPKTPRRVGRGMGGGGLFGGGAIRKSK